MKTLSLLATIVIGLSADTFARVDSIDTATRGSFDLMIANTGLSFGNGQDMNGIRFAWRDGDFVKVNGLNFSFWKMYDNPSGVVNGISVGILGPGAKELRGVSCGLGGVMASQSMDGINVAGLGLVSQGTLCGINVAGLGIVAQAGITGITFGGLGVVSQGSIVGINTATLGLVSQHQMIGVNIGGLGTVAQGNIFGFNVGGLGLVAQGSITGFSLAGLGIVSQSTVRGVSISGLGLVGQDVIAGLNVAGAGLVAKNRVSGFSFTLGLVRAEKEISGITFAGYKMDASSITGLNLGVCWTESTNLTGLTCTAYNRTYGLQKGLVIGIFNHADDLLGVQIGLLNYVESNPPWLKLLPIINARL
jgi:hypothetical protein